MVAVNWIVVGAFYIHGAWTGVVHYIDDSSILQI